MYDELKIGTHEYTVHHLHVMIVIAMSVEEGDFKLRMNKGERWTGIG